MHLRYFRAENGSWARLTMAFMIHTQWCQRFPHKEHGACLSNRRTRPNALPPRNYDCWPVFERCSK
jgi:hypothetical protein